MALSREPYRGVLTLPSSLTSRRCVSERKKYTFSLSRMDKNPSFLVKRGVLREPGRKSTISGEAGAEKASSVIGGGTIENPAFRASAGRHAYARPRQRSLAGGNRPLPQLRGLSRNGCPQRRGGTLWPGGGCVERGMGNPDGLEGRFPVFPCPSTTVVRQNAAPGILPGYNPETGG